MSQQSWERLHETLSAIERRLSVCVRLAADGRGVFFGTDERTRYAAHSALIQLGEAAKDLPEQFRTSHPDVDWRPMIAMRNRASHAYDLIDWEIIWTTITRDAPIALEAIRSILADEFGTFD